MTWRGNRSCGSIWRPATTSASIRSRFLGKGRPHAPYGMVADAANNLYFMDFGDENVGRVDAKTGAPPSIRRRRAKSRPRRTMLDDEGRLWFAEFAANKLGMFDIKTEAFKEWDVPTPHTYPYDVFRDKNGELWSGGMASDRVLRFDPQSGKSIEYLLPRPTNIRRVFVDDTHHPGDVLGRQQSRRGDCAARAAGLDLEGRVMNNEATRNSS